MHPFRSRARHTSAPSFAAALMMLASSASAQLTWTQLGVSAPASRYAAGVALVHTGSRVMVFGGIGANGTLGDMWQLDALGWAPIPAGPSPRSHSAMAASNDTIALFGGRDPNGVALADAWVWTHSSGWSQAAAVPAAREGAVFVRRSSHSDFVFFGGRDGAVTYGDTWLFETTPTPTWTLVAGTTAPSARFGHAMATVDASTILLFGGIDAAGNHLDDTWLLDELANPPVWTLANPAVRPSPRFGHTLRLAGHRGRVQLFGGDGPGGLLGDTWEWNGATWVPISTVGTPTARAEAALVDGAHAPHLAPWEGLLIGGRDLLSPTADVWQVTSTVPATNTGFGGPSSAPLFLLSRWPWVGGSMHLRILQVPPGAVMLPLAILGLSNTTSSLGPLPINLGPEFNNMSLLVDPVVLVSLDPFTGLDIPVPPSPALIGAHVYAQGIAYGMLGALFSGWGLTSGVDLQLGWL